MEKRRELLAQLAPSPDNPSGADFSSAPLSVAERQELEKEEQQLEADLAGKGIGSGETRRALGTDVSDVRDAMPDGAALIEYIAYNHYTGRLTSEPAYGAVILTRDAPPQWVALGPAAEIDARVRLAQKHMRKRVHDTTVDATCSAPSSPRSASPSSPRSRPARTGSSSAPTAN